MARELVGIEHRYVRALMTALIRGTGDQATNLLTNSFEAVPEVTERERKALLKQLGERLAVVPKPHPLAVAHNILSLGKPVVTAPEEDIDEEILRALDGDVDVTDEQRSLFMDDVSFEDEEKMDPVRSAISEYLDRVVKTLRYEKDYRPKFFITASIIENEPYIIVVTGALRRPNPNAQDSSNVVQEFSIYGTSGDAHNFNDLSDDYFACKGGVRLSAQRELDDVGNFSHIVLWGWALRSVPGREFRFWINRKGGKDLAKIRFRMDPTCAQGFRVTKTYIAKKEGNIATSAV